MKQFFIVILAALYVVLFLPPIARATICDTTSFVAINEETKECFQGVRDWCVDKAPKANKGWKIYESPNDKDVATDTFSTPFGQCQTVLYAEPDERTCCQQLKLTSVSQVEAVTWPPDSSGSRDFRPLIVIGIVVVGVTAGLVYFFVLRKKTNTL